MPLACRGRSRLHPHAIARRHKGLDRARCAGAGEGVGCKRGKAAFAKRVRAKPTPRVTASLVTRVCRACRARAGRVKGGTHLLCRHVPRSREDGMLTVVLGMPVKPVSVGQVSVRPTLDLRAARRLAWAVLVSVLRAAALSCSACCSSCRVRARGCSRRLFLHACAFAHAHVVVFARVSLRACVWRCVKCACLEIKWRKCCGTNTGSRSRTWRRRGACRRLRSCSPFA